MGFTPDEIQRANLLLDAMGHKKKHTIPLPANWRSDLILILKFTDLTPTQCAEVIRERAPEGSYFSWSAVLDYIKGCADTELASIIRNSRAALFERKLENPDSHDAKCHQLILAGIAMFTEHRDDTAGAKPLTINVMNDLRTERIEYMKMIEEKDYQSDLKLEMNKLELESDD